MRRFAPLLLTVVALPGCDTSTSMTNSIERALLRQQQAQWQALGIVDYDFDFIRSCFCGIEMSKPAVVKVRNGLVVGAFDKTTGAEIVLQYPWWPTIDTIFVRLEREMGQGAWNLSITYDADYHFPAIVSGDIPQAIDDEYVQVARNLVRIVK